MEIILKEDVVNLGYKNDIVTVKSGYGRNYLIPTGKAVIASPSAKKMLAEELKQRAHKLEKIKKDAEAMAEQLKDVTLTIATKVIPITAFGSVTAAPPPSHGRTCHGLSPQDGAGTATSARTECPPGCRAGPPRRPRASCACTRLDGVVLVAVLQCIWISWMWDDGRSSSWHIARDDHHGDGVREALATPVSALVRPEPGGT